jgi:hypothetical protein
MNNSLARCPHCRRISAVGSDASRKRGCIFLLAATLSLIMAVAITATTYKKAGFGLYLLYIRKCRILPFTSSRSNSSQQIFPLCCSFLCDFCGGVGPWPLLLLHEDQSHGWTNAELAVRLGQRGRRRPRRGTSQPVAIVVLLSGHQSLTSHG